MSSARKKVRAGKKVTIHDIAREAGVSIGTVSRALNNAHNVNAETRERVMNISRRLGIRPRGPTRRRHFAIVVPDRARIAVGGYVDGFVQELLYVLSSHGCALSVFTDAQIGDLPRWLFDGVFSVTWAQETLVALAGVKETPIVAVNYTGEISAFHVVGWDHRAEGRMVAEYFLRRGHTRLALIGSQPPLNKSGILRMEGYAAACQEAGFPLRSSRVELLESRALLYAAVKRVVDQEADAIFLPGQDRLAVEAIAILQKMLGLRVPADISVVGGENAGWSELLDPPLTTVAAPLHELAERAVEHMLDLVASRPRLPTEMIVRTQILERKSVGDRTGAA